MTGAPKVGNDPLLTTGDVAAALGMSIETIRAALVDHEEYARLSREERARKIPCLRVGSWARVPRWWVVRAVAALRPPPDPETHEDAG